MASQIAEELKRLFKHWNGCPSCGANRTVTGNDKIIYCVNPFCMKVFWTCEDGWIEELQGYIKETNHDPQN